MLYKEELIRVYEEAIAVASFEAKIEARMRVALSMLESEMSYEEIEKFTGMNREEIEYEIESFEIVGGKKAEEIEAETDGSCIDEFHEYLVLHLTNGDESIFRNSHVDMFKVY